MNRLIQLSLLIVLSISGFSSCTAEATRPNVLIVLTDDQGWGDLSIHGNGNLETPNIDQLAEEGTRFDRFFVCPVCSPTRAEFLTGRYYPRGGVKGVTIGQERLDLDEQTIGDVFKEAGYHTGAFGKWHNGTQYPYHPNARGFDEYYGFCSGHWGNYWDPMLDHNGEIVKGKGFIIDDLTDHAIDFIKQSGSQPFFCYVPYNTPHAPMQVPDRWWDRHKTGEVKQRHRDPQKEKLNHTRAALAMCENIDWNVGRLLKTLEEQQIADSTIVIYFSDNGPNGFRWNDGMKGRKGTTDEGGVRSPFFIRWPGEIKAGRVIPQIAGGIDLLPTLTELAGIERSGTKPLDGRSLKPLLMESNPEWPDRMIVSHWGRRGISVRNQKYRLDGTGHLFDMTTDPGQQTDVAADHPEVTKALKAEVTRYKQTILSEYDEGNRPFAVGHKSGTVTQLPIRDAVAVGNLKRTARPPNSSWFTNWISTDDAVTWAVEVSESAQYSAELFYTCKQENAGVVIRLEGLGGSESTAIERELPMHESEIIGAEQDRDLRPEAYEQNWGRVTLGTIKLDRKMTQLKLTAPKIPGQEAIDVRLLLLRRLSE